MIKILQPPKVRKASGQYERNRTLAVGWPNTPVDDKIH